METARASLRECSRFIEGGSLADSQNYLGNLKIFWYSLECLGSGQLFLKVPQEDMLLLCAWFGLQFRRVLTCC